MRPKLTGYVVVCCLLYAVSVGQRLSKVVPIPDTLSNLGHPQHLTYNARLGKLYVLGGYIGGGSAIVIDVATGRKTGQVRSCDDVSDACLNWHDDRLFCAKERYRRICVVNCSTDVVIDSVVTTSEPWSVQYGWRQGKVYVAGFDSAVGVLDARNGSLIRTVSLPGYPWSLHYCEDLDRLYATVHANESLSRVCAIDCRTDSVVAVVDVHAGIGYSTESMVYDAPSRRLFCSNVNPWNDITVIDCTADTLVGYVPVGDYPLCLVREPTTGRIWCANHWSENVSVIDPATLVVVDTLPLSGGPTALYVNERAGLLYCTCPDSGMVYAIDPVSCLVVAAARTGADPSCMAVPDLGGRLYVANANDNTVTVRDPGTLDEVAFIPVGQFTPYYVCTDTSRNLTFALSVGGGDALLTTLDCTGDTITRNVAVPGTSGRIGCVAALDKVYICTQQPEHIDIVQGSTGRLLKVLPGGQGTSWEPIYAWNAGKVYVVTNWGWLAVVDAQADTLISLRELFGQTSSACYDPVGNKLYIAEDAEGRIQVLDCSTDSVVKVLTHIATPAALCYEPSGNKVYSANAAGWSISVVDCTRDTVVKTFRVGPAPCALALSPASRKLYCANYGVYPNHDSTVSVVDIDRDSVIRTIGVGLEPGYTMCYNPTTDKMFVGTGGIKLAVIRCSDDSVVRRVQIPGGCRESAVLPSANRLYVPSGGNRSISVVQDSAAAGLEEQPVTDAPFTIDATVIRRVLHLPVSPSTIHTSLFDMTGRRVMSLSPGPNDISRLAPGVYFMRRESGVGHEASSVIKVVLTR